MDNLVFVTSNVDHKIGIKIPDISLRVVWEKKGAKKPIPLDKFQMAMYNSGVEYMLNQGMLIVEDKKSRIALGMEMEDEEVEPVALTDKQKENLWKNATLFDFKSRIKDLPYEQIKMLADWAVKNDYTNHEKSKVIKECIGVDTVSKIALNHTGDD